MSCNGHPRNEIGHGQISESQPSEACSGHFVALFPRLDCLIVRARLAVAPTRMARWKVKRAGETPALPKPGPVPWKQHARACLGPGRPVEKSKASGLKTRAT